MAEHTEPASSWYLVRINDQLDLWQRYGYSWWRVGQSRASGKPDEILSGPLDLSEMAEEAQARKEIISDRAKEMAKASIGAYMADKRPRVARTVPEGDAT